MIIFIDRAANIYFAIFIIDDNTGRVVNGGVTTNFTTNAVDIDHLDALSVFPNPSSDISYVRLDLNAASNVDMTVMNSMGQIVAQRNYGQLSGDQLLPVELQNFQTGVYYIRLNVDGQIVTEKLTVKR